MMNKLRPAKMTSIKSPKQLYQSRNIMMNWESELRLKIGKFRKQKTSKKN